MRLMKKERIFTIIVVPHSEDSVFSFRLSLFFFQILCLFLIGSVVLSLIICKNYYNAEKKLIELNEIKLENCRLRDSMDLFAQETEDLKLQLAQMSILSSEIKALAEISSLDQELKGSSLFFEEQELTHNIIAGRGGNPVLDRVHINISMLQQSIPQKKEQLFQIKNDLQEYQRELACTPSIWPTRGKISSPFGLRNSPFTGKKEFHYGLDIAAPSGTPIYAAADGKIIEAKYRRGTGNVIIIDHGYSFKTLYAHLSRFGITQGEIVQKGQVIGYIGSTGLSTGPHLHYEVHVKGVAVNPVDFLY